MSAQDELSPDRLPRSDAALAGEGEQREAWLVLVAAGGTGGHLFPAEALAAALAKRGMRVELATDARAERYGGAFAAEAIHVIPSETVRGFNPFSLARSAAVLLHGIFKARRLLPKLRPAIVVGFGGYPTVPPVLAACRLGIPTLIHEQNAVMGRANRLLAKHVTAIATGFAGVTDGKPVLAAKTTLTGNPVRPAVVAAAATPYIRPRDGALLRLLVFGGSQGARVMADVVPQAVELLTPFVRSQLLIVQQAREEDLARVREAYKRFGVAAEVAPFFHDLPLRMAASHLVVSRSGASTVAELAAIGRPSILVPLPHALDQDQFANAGVLEKASGAIRLMQTEFTPQRLAAEITSLLASPEWLAAMAAGARSVGVLDAAEKLADLVLRVAGVVPAAMSDTSSPSP
jgi:UDP-N-acetylglucosamine--N-acetylmuramyl-(pentapeptide) pyrophosphoryl-undecaprenol N-acetylglucosamine transferase